MKQKLFAAIAALAVTLGMAGRCFATQTGSMRVSLGREEEVTEGGSVAIYQVGLPISGGYRLNEAFGGGVVALEDVYSVALAAWLAEQADSGGTKLLLDADGNADFTGLTEGLYLLVQEEQVPGYYPMAPFLVEIPYLGMWDVEADPKEQRLGEPSPKTGQSSVLIVACGGLMLSGLAIALLARQRNTMENEG